MITDSFVMKLQGFTSKQPQISSKAQLKNSDPLLSKAASRSKFSLTLLNLILRRWQSLGLRPKVLSVISAAFFILFWGQLNIACLILLKNSAQLEQEKARINAERVHNALLEEISQLDGSVSDHATWNDTYAFVENGNPNYLSSNFANSTFIEYELNAFLIVDNSGQIIASKGFDLHQEQQRSLPSDLLKLATEDGLLRRYSHLKGSIGGIVILSEGPMLVATHPILTSNYQGPTRGTLIMGRFLNQAGIEHLAKTTQLSLSLHDYHDPQLQADLRSVQARLSKDNPVAVKTLDDDTIASYILLSDIFEQPALILRSEMNRRIYAQGKASLGYYFWSTLAIGVILCFLSLLLLERLILYRLSRLSQEVNQVGTSGNLSARVLLPGKDELSSLAQSINWTLDQLEQSQQNLKESEERYTLSVQGAKDGVWDWNLLSDKIYFSPRWKSMLGWQEDEMINHIDEWIKLVHHEDLERFQSDLLAHLWGMTAHFESEYRIRHKDGSYHWVLSRGLVVRDQNGKAYRIAGSQTNLTNRKALYDELTGLPNRNLFLDQLGRALAKTKGQRDYLCAVIFLDCDRFKVINDSLGHLVGDQLLIGVAQRLQACLRPGDLVARLGGDEFTILLENIKDISEATSVASRINEELKRPFKLMGHIVYTAASLGIALSSKACNQPEDLLRNADTAMYHAKAQGKARYEVFDFTMYTQAQARLELETELQQALERSEFQLDYQPIVSLDTETLIGFEALIRWQHPIRGLISPGDFVPVAEETGLIIPISEWVLYEACRQMRVWQKQFLSSQRLMMAVNLSRKQLSQPHLAKQIKLILQQTSLDANNLKLEITETAIMDNDEAAADTLWQLKKLGVQLSIDDFGTGYSSLSCLSNFPINTLKIDRSFISSMGVGSENSEIVRTIVTLAHNLGMKVTAEGVETTEQLFRLKTLSCDRAQGYFFAKPLAKEAVEALISEAF